MPGTALICHPKQVGIGKHLTIWLSFVADSAFSTRSICQQIVFMMIIIHFSALCRHNKPDMLLYLSFVLPLAWAQFPAVCNTQDSLSTKTCCPDNCGSRGICVSIHEEVQRSWNLAAQNIVEVLRDGPPNEGWPLDLCYQWPVRVFDRVCLCHEGWGGYDCSHCDFGYIVNAAGECVKRNATQLLVRQNFKKLSDQEQRNYVKLLEGAKTEEEKKWAVVDTEPEEANGSFTLQNVSTYDMFVFVHVLTTRDRWNEDCRNIINPTGTENNRIDFAHRGPHFLTWHRHYLLLIESELRRIGQDMGINNFTLPYFDWTPTETCLIFTHELLGTPEYSYETKNVSGALFENGKWPVVCDQHYRKFSGDPRAYLPTSGGHPGGNLNDYHVPLFPLKTNADMYKLSKELGYRYDGWDWSIPTSDFPIGCANYTEANTCNKGGCLPPTVVGTQCVGCRVA